MKKIFLILLIVLFSFGCNIPTLNSVEKTKNFRVTLGNEEVVFDKNQSTVLFQIWSIERCEATKFHMTIYLQSKDIEIKKQAFNELVEDAEILKMIYGAQKDYPDCFMPETKKLVITFYMTVNKIIREAGAI
jgi:hypothetical protein